MPVYRRSRSADHPGAPRDIDRARWSRRASSTEATRRNSVKNLAEPFFKMGPSSGVDDENSLKDPGAATDGVLQWGRRAESTEGGEA
jgi:hypothetical protein